MKIHVAVIGAAAFAASIFGPGHRAGVEAAEVIGPPLDNGRWDNGSWDSDRDRRRHLYNEYRDRRDRAMRYHGPRVHGVPLDRP
jgi:hypothetical protein